MRVKVSDIREKIKDLPGNVRDLVTLDADPKSGLAHVKSRSLDETHIVHIESHKDDPNKDNPDPDARITILNSTCPCDARELCWHVTAFYAVAKHLLPEVGFLPKTGQDTVKPEEGSLSASEVVRDPEDLNRLSRDLINALASWVGEVRRLLEESQRNDG